MDLPFRLLCSFDLLGCVFKNIHWSLPEREDMTVPVEEHLIVEYYSK